MTDLQAITEGASVKHFAHKRAVEFDNLTTIIIPPELDKGALNVGWKTLSMPLSFTKSPPAEYMDDPDFTPSCPRKLHMRLPSLTRTRSRSNSNERTLRPSFASPDTKLSRTRSTDREFLQACRNHRSPSYPPTGTSSPSSFSVLSSSGPSTSPNWAAFIPRPPPKRANSMSSSVGSFSYLSDHSEAPTEPLQLCCQACWESTELGLRGEWEDAPWSPGALKKKRKDDKEREENELERKRLEETYGKASPTPSGGCVPDEDWESHIYPSFNANVVVDEVSLVRNTQPSSPSDSSSGLSPSSLPSLNHHPAPPTRGGHPSSIDEEGSTLTSSLVETPGSLDLTQSVVDSPLEMHNNDIRPAGSFFPAFNLNQPVSTHTPPSPAAPSPPAHAGRVKKILGGFHLGMERVFRHGTKEVEQEVR